MVGAPHLLARAAVRPGTGAAWTGGLRVFPGCPILVLVFVLYRPGLGASRTPALAVDPGAHPMRCVRAIVLAYLGARGRILRSMTLAMADTWKRCRSAVDRLFGTGLSPSPFLRLLACVLAAAWRCAVAPARWSLGQLSWSWRSAVVPIWIGPFHLCVGARPAIRAWTTNFKRYCVATCAPRARRAAILAICPVLA